MRARARARAIWRSRAREITRSRAREITRSRVKESSPPALRWVTVAVCGTPGLSTSTAFVVSWNFVSSGPPSCSSFISHPSYPGGSDEHSEGDRAPTWTGSLEGRRLHRGRGDVDRAVGGVRVVEGRREADQAHLGGDGDREPVRGREVGRGGRALEHTARGRTGNRRERHGCHGGPEPRRSLTLRGSGSARAPDPPAA